MKWNSIIICIAALFQSSAGLGLNFEGIVRDGDYGIQGAQVTVTAGAYAKSMILDDSHFIFHLPDELITGVTENHPGYTRLNQNYPNPFNPSTTIEFSIESPARVELTIYSITGQRVCMLADGDYSAGLHRLVWDGRDEAGRGVAAGIYFYRLDVGAVIETRRMLLLDGGGGPAAGTPLAADAVPAAKPAGDPVLILDSLVVKRNGYRTIIFEDVRIPIEGIVARMDIELEPESATGGFLPAMTVGDSLRYGTVFGYYEFGFGGNSDSVVVAENAIRIVEEVIIDENSYFLYSDWPPFVPDSLCVDDAPPLIRVMDTGEIFMRFYDRDILLYDLSGSRLSYTIDLNQVMEESDYFAHNPEARVTFEDVIIEIAFEGNGHVISTPGRYYDNCTRMRISYDIWNGDDGSMMFYFFDHSAGFVFRKGKVRDPATVLIGGTVDGNQIGAFPIRPDREITGRDISEMVRMTMEWHMPFARIWDVANNAIHTPELLLASDGLEEAAPYLPDTICGIPLTIMTRQELQARADELGDYPIFILSEPVETENDTVTFELAYYMIVSKHSPSDGYLWGEGYGMEFTRTSGYWIGRKIFWWIS